MSLTGSGALDEDALDQAEALAELGRFDEARALLHAQLHVMPNHPLILERLADIDDVASHANTSHSGNFPVRPGAPSQPLPLSHPNEPQGYEGVPSSQPQIAHRHGMQGASPVSQHPTIQQPQAGYRSSQHPGAQYPGSQYPGAQYPGAQYPGAQYPGSQHPNALGSPSQHPVSQRPVSHQPVSHHPVSDPPVSEAWASEVDSLLDQVREGVRNQVAESDAATHYDLGVAYYEMGLQSDAISELTLAARDPARECVCLSLIATIQLGAGEYDAALDALHRALQASYKTRDQELALAYEIANSYELKMMPEQALEYFDWLWKVDPGYDDPRGNVAERIHHLRTESGAQRRPQPPVAPDEGDLNEAFDDMFEEG